MLLGLLALLCFFTSALLAADITETIIPNTIPLGPLITHAKPYHCLDRSSARAAILRHPDTTDCALALDQILNADKAAAPMLISRTQGFTVPHTWSAGNCAIYVDTSSGVADKPVTLPLTIVVRIALVIMSHCIGDGPGLGGTSFLGSWDDSGGVLDVIVFGRDSTLPDVSRTQSAAQMAAAINRSVGTARVRRA